MEKMTLARAETAGSGWHEVSSREAVEGLPVEIASALIVPEGSIPHGLIVEPDGTVYELTGEHRRPKPDEDYLIAPTTVGTAGYSPDGDPTSASGWPPAWILRRRADLNGEAEKNG